MYNCINLIFIDRLSYGLILVKSGDQNKEGRLKLKILKFLSSIAVGLILFYFWMFNINILFNFSKDLNFSFFSKKSESLNIFIFFMLVLLFNLFIPALIQFLRCEIKLIDDLGINFSTSFAMLSIGILVYGYEHELNEYLKGIYSLSLYISVGILMNFYTFFGRQYKIDRKSARKYNLIPIMMYIFILFIIRKVYV